MNMAAGFAQPLVASAVRRRSWLPYALLAVGLIVARPDASSVADVSGLISTCERMLNGERLYIDMLEPNPPASLWLYLPAVMLARLLGIAPEVMVNAQFFALMIVSLLISLRMLARAGALPENRFHVMFCAGLAIFALLPGDAFGQREHAGTLLLLPMLCGFSLRAPGLQPTRSEQILSGIAAGIAISIKPHFALPVLAALAATWAWNRTFLLLLSAELWISAVVVAVYAGAVVILTPDYITHMLPNVLSIYLPARFPLWQMLLRLAPIIA